MIASIVSKIKRISRYAFLIYFMKWISLRSSNVCVNASYPSRLVIVCTLRQDCGRCVNNVESVTKYPPVCQVGVVLFDFPQNHLIIWFIAATTRYIYFDTI